MSAERALLERSIVLNGNPGFDGTLGELSEQLRAEQAEGLRMAGKLDVYTNGRSRWSERVIEHLEYESLVVQRKVYTAFGHHHEAIVFLVARLSQRAAVIVTDDDIKATEAYITTQKLPT